MVWELLILMLPIIIRHSLMLFFSSVLTKAQLPYVCQGSCFSLCLSIFPSFFSKMFLSGIYPRLSCFLSYIIYVGQSRSICLCFFLVLYLWWAGQHCLSSHIEVHILNSPHPHIEILSLFQTNTNVIPFEKYFFLSNDLCQKLSASSEIFIAH